MRHNNRKTTVKGRLAGTFKELHALGCIQTGADVEPDFITAAVKFHEMFNALMALTQSNPCDGCPALNGGTCPAYLKQHSSQSASKPAGTPTQPNKSVAQIAQELGISKSEVRRRKVAGLL